MSDSVGLGSVISVFSVLYDSSKMDYNYPFLSLPFALFLALLIKKII